MSTNSNVIAFPKGDPIRRARGAFVKSLIDGDGRSIRFMAAQIGISHTALGDRMKGKAPFLADELEGIARVLKIDPVDFYSRYISAEHAPDNSPSSEVTPM